MHEVFGVADRRIIPEFNWAVNEAMTLHLGKVARGIQLSELDDTEFTALVKSSDQQPLNPVEVMRDALGFDEDATEDDIQAGCRDERVKLVQTYRDHGIDPIEALEQADDIIFLTEAYIAGYSRKIGVFADHIERTAPGANALRRWNNHIWVPEEDEHDRLLAFIRQASGNSRLSNFHKIHIAHMQTMIHPSLDTLPAGAVYLAEQEGSTGPSYRNNAVLLGPKLGKPQRSVGKQEDLHTRMYTKVAIAMMEADPERTVRVLAETSDAFDMPARDGIEDYDERAKELGTIGLLDPVDVLDVQRPMIARLGVKDRHFKTKASQKAQNKLTNPDGPYGQVARDTLNDRLNHIRYYMAKRALRSKGVMPAIIGITVVADPKSGELSFPMST
jgi:hypothetical protein